MDHTQLDTDVVILGGGIAGLTCAIGLLDAGVRIIVVEQGAQLGGRARSWADGATGDPVHVGPHVVTDCYPNFFQLLGRLGTTDRVVWGPEDTLYTMFDGAQAIALRRSSLPPPLQFLATLRGDPQLGMRELASLGRVTQVALGLGEEDVLRLDGLDGRSLLAALGVRPAMIRRYWEFAGMSILNAPLERLSAGSMLRAFHQVASRDAVRVGFPGCGLGDLFAPAARAQLEEAGHRVWTMTEAAAILEKGTQATGVRLADGREIRARYVVSTLPPRALVGLVPEDWRGQTALADLGWFEPVPYISVYLWFDRKVTGRQFWARAYAPDDLNCDFYDYSNIYPGWADRPSLIGSNIIDAQRAALLSNAEIVARTRRELAENIPAAAEAEVRHVLVNRIPLAVVAPRPGFEARRPGTVTAIGGLLLAGDWTQTGLPSSMEGAAKSGWRAAEEIWAREGRPRSLVLPLAPRGLLARGLIGAARRLPWPRRLRRITAR